MTNREWLNSMSNEDLVNWIYAEKTYDIDFEKGKTIVYAPSYSPCLLEVVQRWTSWADRLRKWLEEEREEEK